MELLKAENLVKTFGGGFLATNRVSIEFNKGVLTSIIGPNGAGKTTLINLLSGSLKPDSGKVFFDGQEVTDLQVVQRIKEGICRSFQITNIFPKLTVVENVLIPLVTYHKKEAEEILKDIGLSSQVNVKAGHLSHGEQRQLEIGIALATHPQIIFLDEPTQGMNKVEKVGIMEYIVGFSRDGRATFVIIEHDMDIVFSVSQRIVVLHSGAIIADGSPDEIRNNELVRNVYLGEEE
jgi:branched-chain amino acid transport system ATP-binding protein